MPATLTHNSYGKSAVRLAKITRHADRHEFREVHVNIQLEGDFERVYTAGDNTPVLPTDTMKNTIYALAKDHPLATPEDFGLFLGRYFLEQNPQVSSASLELSQVRWDRLTVDGAAHPHSYVGGGNEKAFARLTHTRTATELTSGLRGLRILKTTDSAFEHYIVDRFTTLPPASDRILATELEAEWRYGEAVAEGADFQAVREAVRDVLLRTFAGHRSASVQHTLHAMGAAVLEQVPAVGEITLKMPNLHYIPVNLKPFGLENANEVFLASGDAYGYITGTLTR